MSTPTLQETLQDYSKVRVGFDADAFNDYMNGAMAMYILLSSAYDGMPCEPSKVLLASLREEMRVFFAAHGLTDAQESISAMVRMAGTMARNNQGDN